ncbi:MAG: GNAT family N-acetyltransferase [Scytolyngbya sp. HA4215-MV1]|jgi:hypothetical protein|nr:GNAT family N-acetyltransferase [Scytolyngbya sp. HA4215-MV1]
MQLRRFDHVQDFWQTSQDYLRSHLAEHNLLIGIVQTLLHDPSHYSQPPYLAIVEDQGTLLAVAIRTSPYKLVLSKVQDLAALKLIGQDLQQQADQIPGVGGLVAEVAAFLPIWQGLTGQVYRRVMEMRIHQLMQVEPVAIAQGHLRLATAADRPLLLDWFTDFAAEIGEVVSEGAEQMVEGGLKRQSIYVWDEGGAVCFACGSPSLPMAARIGPVYTPPEYRRRGYATACVAALSQRLLDQGCHSCFLFTNSANPTSNRIYQAIGYRPVCGWHDYAFMAQETP